ANLADRQQAYFSEVMRRASKKLLQEEGFKRVASFLGNPAGCTFFGFMQQTKFILDQQLAGKSAAVRKPWLAPLEAVCCCLFDRIALGLEKLTDANGEKLRARLLELEAQGLERRALAQNWDQAGLSPAPDKTTVDQLLKLLK
ncbi:MAG: hypothetical protein JNK89_06455, partial [Saprospiraceae bacterium]|nr:hypothetical protein [Saprospiraceae bacterium]